ncbi:hypothetical protein [Roseibium sp.]|uniref:hypothetical protein n=1 Tax=Roseibium sp. TaxID=1936156 RepID=UPI003BAEB749
MNTLSISRIGLMLLTLILLSGASSADVVKSGTCGAGWAMTGIHVQKDLFSCIPMPSQHSRKWDRDGATQRNLQHSCPIDWYAIDYEASGHDLLCGKGPQIDMRLEKIFSGKDGQNQKPDKMIGCPPNSSHSDDGRTWVMTGVRVDHNFIACTPLN